MPGILAQSDDDIQGEQQRFSQNKHNHHPRLIYSSSLLGFHNFVALRTTTIIRTKALQSGITEPDFYHTHPPTHILIYNFLIRETKYLSLEDCGLHQLLLHISSTSSSGAALFSCLPKPMNILSEDLIEISNLTSPKHNHPHLPHPPRTGWRT